MRAATFLLFEGVFRWQYRRHNKKLYRSMSKISMIELF